MPEFKENTSPAMKRSGFKLKGYTYPGTAPTRKVTKKGTETVRQYAEGEKYIGGRTPGELRLLANKASKAGNEEASKRLLAQANKAESEQKSARATLENI